MTLRTAAAAGAIAVSAAGLAGQAPVQPVPSRQTFRSGAEVVVVDVSVRSGNQAVGGLTAGDFVLTDNGVQQEIQSVEASAVPIDVTLVVDLSGNPRERYGGRTLESAAIGPAERDAREVAALLRPEDRIRLLAIDTYVTEVWPLQPAAAVPPVSGVAFGGLASLYDTLAAALLQPADPTRRQVVIAHTKGIDTVSTVDPQAVWSIAERSGALLHVALVPDLDLELSRWQCQMMGLCWPVRRFWVPHERRLLSPPPRIALTRDGQTLADAADASGGALHQSTWFAEPSLAGALQRSFEDFRQSYVLRYTPRGVGGPGWHTIAVTVPKAKAYTVRARRGYAVEVPRPPPAAPPRSAEPRTLAELTAAYERGAYQIVAAALRGDGDPERLIRDFTDGGNPWPAHPRREAAFAIELAEAGTYAAERDAREASRELLERFSLLVRNPLEPDEFERAWYLASIALLEGAIRPGIADTLIARAIERFPDEPRFALARAFALDQRLAAPGRAASADGASARVDVEAVLREYEGLLGMPDVAVEARIRLAFLLHRAGRHREALAHLNEAGRLEMPEPTIAYLYRLFLGHVLDAMNRPDDAIDAYRTALLVAPFPQSARVALMNVLLAKGSRAEAEDLAERIQTDRSDEIDPWWAYWLGQARSYQQSIALVRELAR